MSTIGQGSSLDLLVKAPHLTGSIEFRLGFFRGICANQWNAGTLLANVKIRHTGDCLNEINRAIPALVACREKLIHQIGAMQAQTLTAESLLSLAQSVAHIRLDGVEGVEGVRLADLLHVRRAEDRRNDLFSAANVLQENALRYGLRYDLRSQDDRGRTMTRHMSTRPVVETTGRALEMTGSIWEAAAQLLA